MIAALMIVMVSFAAVPALAADDGAPAEAAEEKAADPVSSKAIAAAIVVGVVGAAGAIAMGFAISKSTESMARQPDAAGNIRSTLIVAMALMEALTIYGLLIAFMILAKIG